jgi:hypothetical protein
MIIRNRAHVVREPQLSPSPDTLPQRNLWFRPSHTRSWKKKANLSSVLTKWHIRRGWVGLALIAPTQPPPYTNDLMLSIIRGFHKSNAPFWTHMRKSSAQSPNPFITPRDLRPDKQEYLLSLSIEPTSMLQLWTDTRRHEEKVFG